MTKPLEGLSQVLADTPDGLKDRDPEFIRNMLPQLWLGTQLYFRAEVHGFENVPDEPVLFVGNHSGGASTPDTFVFTLAYHTFFTVEGRPMVALAHEVIVNAPIIGKVLRKFGVVKAGPSVAAEVLNAGANVLVYPGGDVEALRPWKDRNKIVFDGRKGFLRLAHSSRVKIVPVVAVGGQETFFVLNDGRKMAQRLGIDKKLRAKTVPFSLSIPWGLMLGDLPHIPVPAKIRMQVLPPIDVREMFGDDPDWDQAYGYVTSLMQVALSDLAAKTVVPVFG